MTNVYTLGLSYTNSSLAPISPSRKTQFETLRQLRGASELEVRVGYFGICLRSHGVLWLCSYDADALLQQIGPEHDPLDLVGAASAFKDEVMFSGILIMAIVLTFIAMVLLATFPSWHQERDERTGSDVDVKPYPARLVVAYTTSGSIVAAILLLISSLWQHIGSVGAAAMAKTANSGNVATSIGTNAIILVWGAFFAESIIAIGTLVMLLSIIVLDRLTGD